jgi:hypothetical protein
MFVARWRRSSRSHGERPRGGAIAARLFGRGTQRLASSPVRAREAIDLTRDDRGRALISNDRTNELESPMAMADVIGVPPAETALPRAMPLSSRGAFEPIATNDCAPGIRAMPIGDYRVLFEAFIATCPPVDVAAPGGTIHGALIASLVRTTTPRWYDNWTAAALSPQRPPPTFPTLGRHPETRYELADSLDAKPEWETANDARVVGRDAGLGE